MNVYTSFLALSEAEMEAHVDELVNEHVDGAERARVIAYLNQTIATDKVKLRGSAESWSKCTRALPSIMQSTRGSSRWTPPTVSHG